MAFPAAATGFARDELIVGRAPFLGDNSTAVALLHVTEPPPLKRTAFEYRLVMVDAQRQPLIPDPGECFDCNPVLYAACPVASR